MKTPFATNAIIESEPLRVSVDEPSDAGGTHYDVDIWRGPEYVGGVAWVPGDNPQLSSSLTTLEQARIRRYLVQVGERLTQQS